jgi:hypothetical protein
MRYFGSIETEKARCFLLLACGCIGDKLMNLLSRNKAQVEIFILQIKFPSLNFPCQCDIKICQVHVVSLDYEVTIVE